MPTGHCQASQLLKAYNNTYWLNHMFRLAIYIYGLYNIQGKTAIKSQQ